MSEYQQSQEKQSAARAGFMGGHLANQINLADITATTRPAIPHDIDSNSLQALVVAALDSDFYMNQQLFDPEELRLVRILDADYKEQLVIAAQRFAAELFMTGKVDGLDRSAAANVAFDEAVLSARALRSCFCELWTKCEGRKIISGMGSARDHLRTKELDDLTTLIANAGVEHNVSMLGGGAVTGAMGQDIDAWRAAIDSFNQHGTTPSTSEVILVLLKFQKTTRETPSEKGSPGFVSPKQEALLSRTALLFALGRARNSVGGRVNIFKPGGYGTLEELCRSLAESKIGDRVPGFYNSLQDAPLGVLINSEVIADRPFFAGFIKQRDTMLATGAAKPSDFAKLIVDDLDEPQKLVDLMIQHVNTPVEVPIQDSLLAIQQNQQFTRMRAALHEDLSKSRVFNARQFNGLDCIYYRLLDAHFKEQIVHETEDALQCRIATGIDTQLEYDVTQELLQSAERRRGELSRFVRLCRNEPTVTIIGTAKNVWSDELEQLTQHVVRGLVERGYSIVMAGDDRGTLGRIRTCWFNEMADFANAHQGKSSPSKFIRIQMSILGRVTDAESRYGFSETLGPAIGTLMSRTPLISSVGQPKAVIAYPGDLYSLEAIAGVLLGTQLREGVSTAYSARAEIPNLLLLNSLLTATHSVGDRTKGSICSPFYEGLQEQIRMMLDANTIDDGDDAILSYIATDKPSDAAIEILENIKMNWEIN